MKDERLQVIKDSVNLQLALAEKLNFDKNTIELITEEIELLDYITNLQEENERLKGDNEFLKKELIKLERKYLKDDLLKVLQGKSDE